MKLIASTTLETAQNSITFSSVPASFDDLYVVLSGRGANASFYADVALKLNGSTADFTGRTLYGNDGAAVSGTSGNTIGFVPANTATASTFGSTALYIPNYRVSVAKSISTDSVMENNSAGNTLHGIFATLWNQTATISTVELYLLSSANLVAGSIASLYGITKGSDGIVTTS